MTTSLEIDEFLELVERSGLIPADRFDRIVTRLDLQSAASAKDAARTLMVHRLITPFQAERLLDGRARGFFIDHYKVLEILGVGGMGCVYVAEDLNTEQRVALKVLSARNEIDSGMLARFRLEARAGMKLEHPNVCKTLEMGDTGAINFVAMEFFKGISMHELIAIGGPVRWKQCCHLFLQAAKGLHHAHAAGLVHRDVKPANFLVDREGNLKILDFGLALLSDRAEEEFSLALIFGHDCLGTADFIAPEQSLDSRNVDCRADIYSLGCTMYLALTGKFPFPYDTTAKKLEAHRRIAARPVCEVKPDIPADVGAIVAKMMEKRPENRFESCAAVAKALAPYAERQPVKFDFQKILSMRIAENKLRERAMRIGQFSGITATSSRNNIESESKKRLQAQVDTIVQKDTVPMKSDARARSLGERTSDTVRSETLGVPAGQAASDGLVHAVLLGPDNRRILLRQSPMVLGRDPSCQIPVVDDRVSGRHCQFVCDGNSWRMVDLDSKNGVLVNGIRVTERTLFSGDVVTISKRHRFKYLEVDPEQTPSRKWLYWLLGLVLSAVAVGGWFLWQSLSSSS